MSNGDCKICDLIRESLNNNKILDSEEEIQSATRFKVRSGVNKAGINVFSTGRIIVDGPESDLKTKLIELKSNIDSGLYIPEINFPPNIEKYPEVLSKKIPKCDEVIKWYFQESIKCFSCGCLAGSAFMLGVASEKAMLILIETYGKSIKDSINRKKFLDQINNKLISVKYSVFMQSFKSAKPLPKENPLTQDLEQLLGGAFNIYKYIRNDIGHPRTIPDLNEDIIRGQFGHFIVYLEKIYGLIDFFEKNETKV